MKFFRAGCLLVLASTLIFAQALPAAQTAPFVWTGPYVGVHLGYGTGSGDTNFSPLPDPVTFGDLAPTSLKPDPHGVTGGLQAGYNYQVGRFVFGIEADFSLSGMSGTADSSPIINNVGDPLPGTSLSSREKIEWFGTLRPRLGYTALPNLLVYGTGGLAYGEVSYSANTDFQGLGGISFPAAVTRIKVGWTVGGGAEYAFAKNWTIRAEYLYIDLGNQSAISDPGTGFQIGYKWETTAHVMNLGVNYKF